MSTSGVIAPISFTGVSTYSNDFQTILTRAVGIASLPLTQLQNTESDILQKKTQLSSFGDSVTALGASFTNLATAVAANGITASSSNSTIVTATASNATAAANYTINFITSFASPASETTSSGFADSTTTAVSTTGSLKLVVGSKTYNISLSSANNNLLGLRDAINSLGAGVSASILTTGSATNPNYLSLSANQNGHTTLQLIDDPTGAKTNILTSQNQGFDAVFKLNGITIDRQSNTVNDVVPGLSFTLQTTSSNPVTLSLSTSRTALSSALSQFVSAYQGLSSQINGQIGRSAGLLSGDIVVTQTQGLMRQIAAYGTSGSSSTSAVQSLADLGITFDHAGQISFDPTKINSMSDSQLASAFSFVGNASTGLASFASKLQMLSDPVTGFIKTQQDSYTQTDTQLKKQIASLQTRISTMQQATQSRLQAMDALLASLQSQQQVITASVKSVDLALFGKQQTSY